MSAYDTPAFVASEMCLVCGGGQLMEDSWYDTLEVQEVEEVQEVWSTILCGTIVRMLTVTVVTITTRSWYWVYYNDDDFTSNEMCCACGGGPEILVPYVPYSPYQPEICIDTNDNEVNSDGYSCSYINLLHDNENIACDCDTS